MKRQQTSLLYNRIEILANRYFEATATPEEERELCRLLAEPTDSRHDDLRACLGFAVTARRRQATATGASDSASAAKLRRRRFLPALTVTSAAAAIALFALIALRPSTDEVMGEDCRAYVAGKMHTDEAEVLKIMQTDLANVLPKADAEETIEAQMKDILSAF